MKNTDSNHKRNRMPGVENANAETWLVVSGQFSSCPTDHWPLTTDHRPPTTSFTNSSPPLRMVGHRELEQEYSWQPLENSSVLSITWTTSLPPCAALALPSPS